ncbi:oxysterol-binding protein-related protein 8 isoform X2 [Cryptotermes secundus]|uniref:oxysterol-binding protein-related protein 8 isoform X2 n=1 Tax=Cryptotermes secundus TaxID=105785 RepID=UPI001454C18A|nr:oxysterol-binding protein-related protein 8 isoform X2 [Cryptotermes secundus]
MSSPAIPVPPSGSRNSPYESLSHSHPSDSGNKPVLSPITANRNPDDKKSRRTSLQVLLPKLPSSESLNYSPSSPGVMNWLDNSAKADHPSPDKLHTPDTDKLTRKESYKAQRKNYCREKKRVANELLSSLKDPSVIVLADWLKVRGTLKSWTKLWCILKPGLLLLYKSPKAKSNHWVGTVLLNTCQVIERPSKKDGFCFKLFHPLEQSIWAPRGPEKETIGAVVQPLPTAYLIFRAPSQAAGKCWMDALELSLRCSSLLVRSMSSKSSGVQDSTANHETQWSEADYERHFTDHDLDDISQPDVGGAVDHLSGAEQGSMSESESEGSVKKEGLHEVEGEPLETPYIHHGEVEEFGSAGEQVEELAEEHKSLIWYLVKQVRPGMDLSKVVLPTFILEPRSFLDKLSDSYYHADILSKAVLEDDAFTRMKGIVKWYLSGFYKKPKGLKKPYNPILGETFRCYWKHANGSRTFYLAEQVSHHPPVSAFYVTNRQDGFCISASILAKSKFYGNSTSAILDGVALLTLLPRGEDYSITIPYAHCKGILMGTLTMELGGKVVIDCEKTGYKTEIEFKLKPFLGGAEQTNAISGRLKLGKETLATIEGYWDGSIFIKDRRMGEEQLFWKPTPEVRSQRLKRFTVPVDQQGEFESEHLWQHVSAAIARDDQVAATEEKTALEEAQRAAAKERKMKCLEWIPKYFEQDLISGQWMYKHADLRPWDPRNDVCQYEYNYVIQTKTRHQTPMIRTASIVSVDPQTVTESRSSISALKSSKHHLSSKVATVERQDSASSSPDGEFHSDSSQSENESHSRSHTCCRTNSRLIEAVSGLENTLQDQGEKLGRIQRGLEHLAKVQREISAEKQSAPSFGLSQELVLTVVMVVVLQSILTWLFCHK